MVKDNNIKDMCLSMDEKIVWFSKKLKKKYKGIID